MNQLSFVLLILVAILATTTNTFLISAQEQPMQIEDQISSSHQGRILREKIFSAYDENDLLVIDQRDLPQFSVLKEIEQFKNGFRVLSFGADSIQSAVATKSAPHFGATNASFPLQQVDWDARPVFRYVLTSTLAVPYYELRADKYLKKKQKYAEEMKSTQPIPPATPENILMIGLGSGTVMKAFEKLAPNRKNFKRFDIIEIDDGVIYAAEKYFGIKNVTAEDHSVNIYRGDAFEILDRQDFKSSDEHKYDIIIIDCANSGNTHNNDPLYPLKPKGLNRDPEISQPLSCFKPSFVKLLHTFYLRNKETSVVVANVVGFLEPAGSQAQKPMLRVLKTFKTAFQRDNRPIIHPCFLRKYKDGGFRSEERGHSNAKHFDNSILFVTWRTSYEPSIQELNDYVEKEVKTKNKNDWKQSRFDKIAEKKLYTDLIKNRYEAHMKEMEDDIVILPRTERKQTTVKVKELPDFYVPLKERDEAAKKKVRGSIWHEY